MSLNKSNFHYINLQSVLFITLFTIFLYMDQFNNYFFFTKKCIIHKKKSYTGILSKQMA